MTPQEVCFYSLYTACRRLPAVSTAVRSDLIGVDRVELDWTGLDLDGVD